MNPAIAVKAAKIGKIAIKFAIIHGATVVKVAKLQNTQPDLEEACSNLLTLALCQYKKEIHVDNAANARNTKW